MCMFLHYTPASRGYGCIQPSAKVLHYSPIPDGGTAYKTPYESVAVPLDGWLVAKYFAWPELTLDKQLGSHVVHAFTVGPAEQEFGCRRLQAYSVGVLGWGGYRKYQYRGPSHHIGSMALFVPACCYDTRVKKETVDSLTRVLSLSERRRFDALLRVVPPKIERILDTHYRNIQW